MKKLVAIYIHGYLSGGNSSTGTKLREDMGHQFNILTPEVNGDPVHSLQVINDLICETKPAIIIGSSMGGLYALACDSGDADVVLVNPLLTPVETITEHFLNKTFPYHSPRLDGAIESTITDREFAEFSKLEAQIPALIDAKRYVITAILSTRDELLGDSHINILKDNKVRLMYLRNDFGHRCAESCYDYIETCIQSSIIS